MMAHPNPKKVFVGGGGEGATLRESLKSKTVELSVMCDLDEKVVDLCRQHLRNHHKGALDAGFPRVKLIYEDAKSGMEVSPSQLCARVGSMGRSPRAFPSRTPLRYRCALRTIAPLPCAARQCRATVAPLE